MGRAIVLLVLASLACDPRRANGESCIKDRDCESELCRSGTCTPPRGGLDTMTNTGGAAASSTASGKGGAGGSGGSGTGGMGGVAKGGSGGIAGQGGQK
jgi:hypothetical protein